MIAAIYARKSTDQNGVAIEQKSVTRQIESARTYAEKNGWTLRDEFIYADDGVSHRSPAYLSTSSCLPEPSWPPHSVAI